MDVLVLIKNNIKYKKGSFTSIIILMMIISLSVTAIVSLKKNFPDSIRAAYERVYDGNITLNICDRFLTSDMVDEVAEHPLVKKVEVLKALSPDGFKFSRWPFAKRYCTAHTYIYRPSVPMSFAKRYF